MLPTPSTSHVDYDRIYEPAEDSFLFLDTLSSAAEAQFLHARFAAQEPDKADLRDRIAPLVLEVGTGSGVILGFVIANAQAIFGVDEILAIGTDVNSHACQATRQTVADAGIRQSQDIKRHRRVGGSSDLLAIINADLTSPLRLGVIDVIIFNPPYVPTSDLPELVGVDGQSDAFAEDSRLLALSYAGGRDGMEVTQRLLAHLPEILNPKRGVAYILLCHQNRPLEVIDHVHRWGPGWSVAVVGKSGKQAGWEKLQIIRIARETMPR